MNDYRTTRIERKEAEPMSELISQYIRSMKLTAGLNRQQVFHAWDTVSGAGKYTIGRFYKGGTLYVTISSSVVRSQLWMQRATLVRLVNEELKKDELYDRSEGFVRDIVLK